MKKILLVCSVLLMSVSSMAQVQTCSVSNETAARIDQLKDSGSHPRVIYTTIKVNLQMDECVGSQLDKSQITSLAQLLLNPITKGAKAASVINTYLAFK